MATGITLKLWLQLHPHSRNLKRVRKIRPVRPSHANELWYKAELLRMVRLLRKSAEHHLLPALKRAVGDSADVCNVGDASRALDPQWNAMKLEFTGIDGVAHRLAVEAVQKNLRAVDERLKASIRDAVKVDVSGLFANDHELRTAMSKAVKDNVALITSIPPQYFEKLEKAVTENFVEGVHYERLQKIVEHVGDVTESRAKLIARDQTSKMNSAFNKQRQTSLGIQKYTWQTMEDERVRETHAELDQTVCRWDDPPDIDGENLNPGEDIDCRCLAEPEFDLDEE